MFSDYVKILIAFIIILLTFVLYQGLDIQTDNKIETRVVSEQSDYFEVKVEYPENKLIGSREVKSFIEERVENFKEFALEDVPELRNRGFVAKYSLNINLENYKSKNYISYVLFISEYTGGANVNQIVESFVYEEDSENKVSITDVVYDKSKFISELYRKLEEKDKSIGIFSNDIEIESINNFYITDSSLVVLFSKYEVAPGAAGIVTITIPREKL